jgi:hypothetical protein
MASRETKSLKAPTGAYLHALKNDVERDFQSQNEQIDRLRELRSMAKRSPIPDILRLVDIEIRDPTIADEIQRVVATLINQPPKLSVKHGKTGNEEADVNASEREAFTEEVFRIAGTRSDGPPTLTRLADAVAGDGGACTKFLFRNDLWDERYSLRLAGYDDALQIEAGVDDEEESDLSGDQPAGKKPKKASKKDVTLGVAYPPGEYQKRSEQAKKEAGPPFSWTAVDIRNVYPVYQGGKIGEVIEVSERPVSSTFRRYRLAYNAKGDVVPEELAEPRPADAAMQSGAGDLQDFRTSGQCLFVEHWDEEYCTLSVAGKNTGTNTGEGCIVDQWKHEYGRHPYFFTLGFMPTWWTNRKVGWSISETKRWLVEFRSYLWTIFAQQMARDTLPPVSVEVPETSAPIRGSDGTPKANEPYEIGKQYFGQPGQKRIPFQFQQTSGSLKEMIALVTEMIDRLGTPRLEQNIGSVEASGFAINQVLAEARLRFDPLAQAIERTLEQMTRFLWHLIRTKVGETVWVYSTGKNSGWKGLGPKDLQGDVRIEWKLDPTLPSAALVESRYWVEQVKSGFASMDQAIEAQGRNPDEVRYGLVLDRMRQAEWYMKFQEQYVTSQIGRGDLMAKAWTAQQLAETGAMPGAVPPGQMRANTDPNAVAANGQPPAGMGAPGIPDMAAGQIAPNQAGANGVPMQAPGASGGLPGGPSTPTASAAGGLVQPLR